jgi:hypothetical protein
MLALKGVFSRPGIFNKMHYGAAGWTNTVINGLAVSYYHVQMIKVT